MNPSKFLSLITLQELSEVNKRCCFFAFTVYKESSQHASTWIHGSIKLILETICEVVGDEQREQLFSQLCLPNMNKTYFSTLCFSGTERN